MIHFFADLGCLGCRDVLDTATLGKPFYWVDIPFV
jgi:hypothetical protein